MVFVADDFGAWLVGSLADAGRKKLAELVLGTSQERALRQVAGAAVRQASAELCPVDERQAAELTMAVSHVFSEPVPAAPLAGHQTLLEALGAGVAAQLAALDDAGLTGTSQSAADVLGVPGTVVAGTLTGHVLREIVTRGARGGPLFPLACQLNDDVTHLQGQRLEGALGEVLTRLEELGAGMAPASAALAQLPPEPAGFTGRGDDLAVLAGLLNPRGPAGPVLVSAIAGLAGVGKTTLAVAAGHAAVTHGWFAGGALFIDLHGYDHNPVEPAQALDVLLRALGVPAEHIPPGTEQRAGLYRSVLARLTSPVLVIADNASSEAQVRLLLPGGGPHKVLVTSRHTLAGLGGRLLDVTVLDLDTAVALLDAAVRTARPGDDRISGDKGAAGRLAGLCGGLPLALQITAALLAADVALTAAELAGDLAAESVRLERLAYDDGSGPGGRSVAAAFELSYRRLDDITARVFRLLPASAGPDISAATAAVLADLSVAGARRVLGALARAHLVEAAPGRRWRMHDLLGLYARHLSGEHAETDGREQARDRLLGHYLTTASAADGHLRALPGVAVPDQFTGPDDALAWLDTEHACLVAAVNMAAATGRDRAALLLPLVLAGYFAWRRRFDDWLAVTAISLDVARRLGDRWREGIALSNLGAALWEVRRFEEAITACRDAAAIHRAAGDQRGEGMALTNLGLVLREVRRFEEAITACRDAAAIHRAAGDRRNEGIALNCLGMTLWEVGRFEEAITAHQAAAAIYRETGDRHGEGMALNNLSVALRGAGRFEEAITACQDAAAIFRAAGDRHREGIALTSLGSALRAASRVDEAVTAYQVAAAIYRETGDWHSEGMALNNLGVALQEVRRFEGAITACQNAAAIFLATDDRHREGLALNNLGTSFWEVNRVDEAITAHQAAAAIYRETGDQQSEAGAMTSLGLALWEARRFEQAIIACQDAVAIYHAVGDQDSEAGLLDTLGLALVQTGRFEEAIIAWQDAAAVYRTTGDQGSEAEALSNLGLALVQTGRFEEAITVWQDAVAIYRTTGDQRSEGAALNNLGMSLRELGRRDEAITALQAAAVIYRHTGNRHREGIMMEVLQSDRAGEQA